MIAADVLIPIVARLRHYKDVATFGTLSSTTRDIVYGSHDKAWHITVTCRLLCKGIQHWIERHGHRIHSLRYKNCVYSYTFDPPQNLPNLHTLELYTCRVGVHTVRNAPPSLQRLVIHQLVPGEDPGCLTHALRNFQRLEHLDIVFDHEWGLIALGPLGLPRLKHMALRCSTSHLMMHGDYPPMLETISINAQTLELPGEKPLPKTCQDVRLYSRDAFINPHDLFPDDTVYDTLTRLELGTMGLVFPTFLEQLPSIEAFVCRCDSFVFARPLGRVSHLTTANINVKLCFVCDTTADADLERFFKSCTVRTTVEEQVYDVAQLFS